MHARTLSHRGFALREAVTLAALAGVALALLTPAATYGAGQSRLQVCMGRLKDMAKTSAMFANDNQNRIATFRGGSGMSRWRTLANHVYDDDVNNQQAWAADMAVDIIRLRGKRSDLQPITGWIANSYYSHLMMADYNGEELPAPNYVCPEDENVLTWQTDPRHFNDLGVPSPVPPGRGLSNNDMRWAYVSSYVMPTAAWTNDFDTNVRSAWYFNGETSLVRLGGHTPGTTSLGHRTYDQVAFPSAKVHFYDRGARHFTPHSVYWGFVEQKQPLLFFDGVVRTTRTGAADPGWSYPNRQSPLPLVYGVDFTPATFQWHPGRPEGETRNPILFNGARWAATRDGLAGRDLPR